MKKKINGLTDDNDILLQEMFELENKFEQLNLKYQVLEGNGAVDSVVTAYLSRLQDYTKKLRKNVENIDFDQLKGLKSKHTQLQQFNTE